MISTNDDNAIAIVHLVHVASTYIFNTCLMFERKLERLSGDHTNMKLKSVGKIHEG